MVINLTQIEPLSSFVQLTFFAFIFVLGGKGHGKSNVDRSGVSS